MRAPYTLRKRLAAIGIVAAITMLGTTRPVTANPDCSIKPGTTDTNVTTEHHHASVRPPRLRSTVALRTADGDLTLQSNDLQEIEAGEYYLLIPFASFSDLSASNIKMSFDGENLTCRLSAYDENGELYTKAESIGLQPQESLGLEVSDVVELLRLQEEPIEISAETLTTEEGFNSTPYLSRYLDIIVLSVQFWVGVQ